MAESTVQDADMSALQQSKFASKGAFVFVMLVVLVSSAHAQILTPPSPTDLERLAAREVHRYVYLAGGGVLPIVPGDELPTATGLQIVIGRRDRDLVAAAQKTIGTDTAREAAYCVDIADVGGRRVIVIAGADDVQTLYGAYHFARLLGVRFALHGDIVPDRCALPAELNTGSYSASPLFEIRGIQPFHDFPEGPDWWNVDEYKAVLAQLPKLRMNFIGLHTYPEGGPNAEPTVWIGPPGDFDPNSGDVSASYPSSYHNTIRGGWNWGYAARKTSDYCFGAALLFDRDAFGPEVMRGKCPQPTHDAASNALFNETAAMLRDAFTFARRLGVKICVGTETPLTIPAAVRERLAARGVDVNDPNTVRTLYEGMFRRAAAAYPLDYYWFWTPETWTWGNASDDQVQNTLRDLKLALAAHGKVRPGFGLATCGWVLGPQDDRALFDQFLPQDVAVSCINRQVGHSPVEKAFARVSGRDQWAIPWLEDDQAMTTPQLWAGRMRRDAVDALNYGCNGLIGIHWRTRVLAPNVLALADAAWDQSSWDRTLGGSGALDGSVATYGQQPIAHTDDDALYQYLRWGMTAYRFSVPPGEYAVRLHFSESHFADPNQRVFGVTIQGKQAIERLDIIEAVGRHAALVKTFNNIAAPHGTIDIEWVPIVENPTISAIEVIGDKQSVRINCGGPAVGEFEADRTGEFRFCPADDFYADWCRAMFGEAVADEAAALFTRLDGHLPRPAGWIGGPGGIAPDPRPWEEVRRDYAFVDEFAALAERVEGPRSRDRYDYWLATFRYTRAIAKLRCTWHAFDRAMVRIDALDDPNVQRAATRDLVLPLRRRIIADLARVHEHLYATISTTGALGTLANWQQHNIPRLLAHHEPRLRELLGGELPASAMPPQRYVGPPRLIVLTPRTLLEPGEPLRLRALVLSEDPPQSVTLRHRTAGETEWRSDPFTHVARGVYVIEGQPPGGELIEYFVETTFDDGTVVRRPTGGASSLTAVVGPSRPG